VLPNPFLPSERDGGVEELYGDLLVELRKHTWPLEPKLFNLILKIIKQLENLVNSLNNSLRTLNRLYKVHFS